MIVALLPWHLAMRNTWFQLEQRWATDCLVLSIGVSTCAEQLAQSKLPVSLCGHSNGKGQSATPIRPPQPIQHMPPQWMVFRQSRMVEIVGGIMRHAELFHNPARSRIRCNRERHD